MRSRAEVVARGASRSVYFVVFVAWLSWVIAEGVRGW